MHPMDSSLNNKKVGIALGGGGIRGLAHIPVLKVLDELGIQPSLIAGTSMGAIVGALYATGMSANDIEKRVNEHIILRQDNFKSFIKKGKHLLNWVRVFGPELDRGGLVEADGLFQYLFDELLDLQFQDLPNAFMCIATDYYTAEQVIFREGLLLPAVLASMSVPGVFSPQVIDGKTLVDGGLVNNLAYDLIQPEVDFCIAIELTNLPARRDDNKMPRTLDVATGAIDIMQFAAIQRKLKTNPPDILICPELENVGMFDFHKIEYVLGCGEKAAEELRTQLTALPN